MMMMKRKVKDDIAAAVAASVDTTSRSEVRRKENEDSGE